MGESTLERRARGPLALSDVRAGRGLVLAALAAGLGALGALFLPEIRAAVEIWDASTAYGHCYLVLPMTLYLLWDRRAVIAQVPALPQPGWALLGLPVAAAWLLAERLGIMEGRQLTAVAGFELVFLCVLGWRLYRALSGPLLYLFFLVPFGAFVTPVLQRFTADFSIVGLNLLGIPNFSDNFTIETPVGVFFVAEACAGLRFLIAAVAFGVFYALLNYRSPARRLAFIAASIAVPIIANGFRALGIVVLGQILGSAEAAAADHVIYGWVFFSIVMLLLVTAGLPLRESGPVRAAVPAPEVAGPAPSPFWGALAAVLLVGAGPAASALLQTGGGGVPFASAPAFELPNGCVPPESSPIAPGAPLRFRVVCGGRVFEVEFSLFPARSSPSALSLARRRATQELGAEDVSVTTLQMADEDKGKWTLVETSEPNRATAYASWVDGKPAGGGLAGRLAQARSSLFGAKHAPVLITISVDEPERISSRERQMVANELRAIVDAQPNLGAAVERLSRLP